VLYSCGQNAHNNQFDHLDTAIDSLLNLYHAAGVSISIVQDDQVIYSKGYGYRNVEKKLPVDEHTVFGTGSCSKAFTAAVMGLLEEQGKLDLEEKPNIYIPELKFYNKELDDQVKLRHTLTHSVGLSPGRSETSMILFQPEREEDLIPRLAYLPPIAAVGEEFLYSNYMYMLAAAVAERVSGKDWQSNIKELIFDPLDMKDSRIGHGNASGVYNYATGYAVYQDAPRPVVPSQILGRGPGGYVYSSADDMSRWMIAWLDNAGSSLLSSDYIRKSTHKYQPLSPPENRPDADPGYGFGWFIENFYGLEKVHHGGSISGYCANVALFPSESIGITVLTNQTNSSLANAITALIEDELLDMDRGDDSVPLDYGTAIVIEPMTASATFNVDTPLSLDLNKYIGSYKQDGFGTINLFKEEGHLYARFPFTTFRLIHAQGDTFSSTFTEEVPTIMTSSWLRFTFITEGDRVTGISLNIATGGQMFNRVDED